MDRVTVSRQPSGDYRWVRRTEHGAHVATSDEAYTDVDQAVSAASFANPGLPIRAWRPIETEALSPVFQPPPPPPPDLDAPTAKAVMDPPECAPVTDLELDQETEDAQ